MRTLLYVRAAIRITRHRRMLEAQREETLRILWMIGGGTVATLCMHAHWCLYAGRAVRWFVYIPLMLMPLNVAGGVWLFMRFGRQYGAQLLRPMPQILRKHRDIMEDPRLPFWRAVIHAQDELVAFTNVSVEYRGPRVFMSYVLTQAVGNHLRLAYALTHELYSLGEIGCVHVADVHAQMAEEMASTLEADVRMMQAFRVAPVE